MEYIRMTGDEFKNKVLTGERDFSRIELPIGTVLSDGLGLGEFGHYLLDQEEDLRIIPLNLRGSKLERITAIRLNLPNAHLEKVSLCYSCLQGINLGNAKVRGAIFLGTDLTDANLAGVKGLQYTQALDFAIFYRTKVTSVERKIIEESLKCHKRFEEISLRK